MSYKKSSSAKYILLTICNNETLFFLLVTEYSVVYVALKTIIAKKPVMCSSKSVNRTKSVNKTRILPGSLVSFVVSATLFALVTMLCLDLVESKSAIAGEAKIRAPKAEFKDPEFVFRPVPDGALVVHDFIVRNIGNDFLFIKKVKTD
ncbi:MAG: hypothetical protein HQK62_01940 [Desulfamplus sp.]|nr:hypothetical protein [Desulfamplus sp.]